jgi:hypothetical protein
MNTVLKVNVDGFIPHAWAFYRADSKAVKE